MAYSKNSETYQRASEGYISLVAENHDVALAVVDFLLTSLKSV
jgi:hypothetical protein